MRPSARSIYIVIPGWRNLTPEERELVENGGEWPLREMEHLPGHETILDYLVEGSLASWTRSHD